MKGVHMEPLVKGVKNLPQELEQLDKSGLVQLKPKLRLRS